jgi:hypothetical protein
MGRKGGFSVQKRLREAAKRQKKMEKAERKARQLEDQELQEGEEQPQSEEDPDIAGIVPGPQPLIYDVD